MSIVDNKTVDGIALTDDNNGIILLIADHMRSEERRVGKEC